MLKGHKVYYKLSPEIKDLHNPTPEEIKLLGEQFEVTEFIPNVTHVQVGMYPESGSLDDIFNYFNWMTNGREGACPKEFTERLKATEGLKHSSMSVGDVVVMQDGKVMACDHFGWKELMRDVRTFKEIWKS